jgi:ATP-dependent protease ClpP protease subunit
MAKTIIFIDSYIGPGYYSKSYVRSMMKDSNDVEVKISSLGGSVNHALDIYDQFAEHGNVTADLSGFCASAATLIALGAKYTRMSENSFYLMHKALSWIDEWGFMNEDDLEEVISKLEKEKKENAKFTLQAAKLYVRKTGKKLNEILDLMKEEIWLSAEEAKEWGFVDEIYQAANKENCMEDRAKVAMIAAAGFPVPERKNKKQPATAAKVDEDALAANIFGRMKNLFTSNQNKKMKKQFLNVNKALKVDSLKSSDEKGVFLNEEQLGLVEACLAAAAQITSERDTAQNDLSTVVDSLDEFDATVKEAKTNDEKVAAVRTLLAAKPGDNAAGIKGGDKNNGKKDDVDWEAIDNLPHNQEADEIL